MISFAQLTVLHLHLIDGVGAVTIAQIIDRKPHDMRWQDLYALTAYEMQQQFCLSQIQAKQIAEGLADSVLLEQELGLLTQHSIDWCTLLDEEYPPLLKEIYAAPAVLYVKGNRQSLHKQALAIVGSRSVDDYGIQVIKQLVPDLVAADYAIISGGARGADSYAHQETLSAGGATVAVLGSGLLKPYPVANERLFKEITERGGALVSSFSLHTSALPGNFPARNRIISGLSKGCVVVQAAKKSGALITAHYALEQGRDVFAVPGPITNSLSEGCHSLLQQGALLVHSSDSVLREYGAAHRCRQEGDFTNNETGKKEQQIEPLIIEEWRQELISLCAVPRSLDELLAETKIDYAVLTTRLFELQVAGLVMQNFMGMWEVKKA